ncbi:uncharacterized protein LOC131957761 [Physella acuta]|uniref:uncharacterized protein LOC131957761 n=1 Tax=Physella acuta TaxID=109671 RepID=UPI0027DD3695|nr:uncharacterized protein LOC131957761 [Physella acuta]
MAEFSDCMFVIPNGRRVFKPGQIIQGKVSIMCNQDTAVSGLNLYIYGSAHTAWDNPAGYVTQQEFYINLYRCLFGNRPNQTGPPHLLTAGKQVYSFAFRLPDRGLPSSFESFYGSIRYYLKFVISMPSRKTRCWYRFFTVLALSEETPALFITPCTGQAEKSVSRALGLGNAGKLILSATANKSAYLPGQTILLNVEAKNESGKDLGFVKASLVQSVFYTAQGRSMVKSWDIRTVVSSVKLRAGQTMVWTNQPLEVDQVPPSIPNPPCRLIQVSYHLRVLVEVPLGHDLALKLQLHITTDAPDCDKQYRPCNTGFDRFAHCVANLPYVPWTVCDSSSGQASRGQLPVYDSTRPTDSKTCAHVSSQAPSVACSVQDSPVAPPTYEEAIAYSNVSLADKGAFLLIRFPVKESLTVKERLLNEQASLVSHGGYVLNFCTAPYVGSSSIPWPKNTAAAVLYFKDGRQAERWMGSVTRTHPGQAEHWSALVSENSASLTAPNARGQTLQVTISCTRHQPSEDTASQDAASQDAASHRKKLNVLAEAAGGRLILDSRQTRFVQGDWSAYAGENQTSAPLAADGSYGSDVTTDNLSSGLAPLTVNEKTTPQSSQEEATPQSSQEEATLQLSQEEATPQTSQEEATPQTSQEEATPQTSQEEATPADDWADACDEDGLESANDQTSVSVVCYQFPDVNKHLEFSSALAADQDLLDDLERSESWGSTNVILNGRPLY